MKVTLAVCFFSILMLLSGFHVCYCKEMYSVPEDIVKLMEEGKFDEARERLNRFRRKAPDNPLAIFYLAQLEKDFNKAIALYKEVEILADSSLASEAIAARAELLFTGGDIVAAENLYKKVVSGYPSTHSCAEALYRLGVIKLVSGASEEARIHFELCLEQEPDDFLKVLAATGIMESHVAREEWKEVLESARKVLEETNDDNPVTPRVLEVIALSWSEMGNDDNAAHYTDRLLKNYPESYQAHAIRARGRSIRGDRVYSFDSHSAVTDSLQLSHDEGETGDESAETESSEDIDKAEYTVQASAFSDKNNALKLHQRLKDAGFDSRLSMKTFANKHFYLVQVGYFDARAKAEKTAAGVTEFTGIKAIVITLK